MKLGRVTMPRRAVQGLHAQRTQLRAERQSHAGSLASDGVAEAEALVSS